MNGDEIEYGHNGFSWTAKEGTFEGTGHTKEEALAALMKAKLEAPVKVVSDLTVTNKVELGQRLQVEVVKLAVKELKNKTPHGMTHIAYYSDAPDFQGYGKSVNDAKLDLFRRKKAAEK